MDKTIRDALQKFETAVWTEAHKEGMSPEDRARVETDLEETRNVVLGYLEQVPAQSVARKEKTINGKRLFWVGWQFKGADWRPIHFPPNEGILGWWKTGEAACGEPTISTLVGWVEAETEEAAVALVSEEWDVDLRGGDLRFVEQKQKVVTSDRFPTKDWMVGRLRKWE